MKNYYLCQDCLYTITNPICTSCFSKQVLNWIIEKKPPKKQITKINFFIKNMIRENEENPSDIRCVICNQQTVSLCTYCFSERAKKFIEKNMSEEIVKQFEEDFDTGIWRRELQ
ncbi:MAG: hypothetical protein ACOC1P_01500 [Minisyncoccales bacterium]